nr:hypothetical protein [Tanacetum cinerariifolium]
MLLPIVDELVASRNTNGMEDGNMGQGVTPSSVSGSATTIPGLDNEVTKEPDLIEKPNIRTSFDNLVIAERIDKIKRQIIDGKLTLMDNDKKLLPKVASTINVDSDSEVEEVVDDHAVFMAARV